MPLFAPIEPRLSGMLSLDSRHTMYWEDSGQPAGIPVVFLHGGPGSGTTAQHRCFFDPESYRIVLFDQRGAGRSTPLGELQDNTTSDLVADMEVLRRHLGIEKWLVFGGSWGSTLALAYAQSHPERCLGLVLRGIFLFRPSEVDWFMQGMRRVFPEPWEDFSGFIPAAEQSDLLQAYYRRLSDPDPRVHMPAARAWSRYEGACSTLLPSSATIAHFEDDRVAVGLARIEAHYFINRGFMPENALLEGVGRLRDIPGIIVQGRYDMVCPLMTAHELHLAWPKAIYRVIPDAGHSAWEPGIQAALVEATESFRRFRRFS
jgi:proline iminopeptidase